MSRPAVCATAIRSWARLDAAPDDVRAAVRELVWRCDTEFTPPLSARPGAGPAGLADPKAPHPDGPVGYFDAIQGQVTVVALGEDGRVCGFMSVARDRLLDDVGRRTDAYVTTIIVAPEARGEGAARRLYEAMFALERDRGARDVATRTWSGNAGHLALLSRLGFHEIARLRDHRGPGVDTVYLSKRLDEPAPR